MSQEEQIIARVLAQAAKLCQRYGQPQVIRLTVYESDEDLRLLRPEDGPDATCEQQRRMTDAVANRLRQGGHVVKLRTLRVADYLQWLADGGLKNTAANRAAWATF